MKSFYSITKEVKDKVGTREISVHRMWYDNVQKKIYSRACATFNYDFSACHNLHRAIAKSNWKKKYYICTAWRGDEDFFAYS